MAPCKFDCGRWVKFHSRGITCQVVDTFYSPSSGWHVVFAGKLGTFRCPESELVPSAVVLLPLDFTQPDT